MSPGLSLAVELLISGLLVLSGILVLVSAIGFLRLPDFFARMHPPALAYSLGSWCVALAGVVYFSVLESRLVLLPLLVPLLLALTVPVTTVLLARAALFRSRTGGGADVPAPLTPSSTPPTMPGES